MHTGTQWMTLLIMLYIRSSLSAGSCFIYGLKTNLPYGIVTCVSSANYLATCLPYDLINTIYTGKELLW